MALSGEFRYLGPSPTEHAGAEAHGVAAHVEDGEHHPVAEAVEQPPGTRAHPQAGGDHDLLGYLLFTQERTSTSPPAGE